MVDTTDGFKLAEVDLAMRGEGEAWGRVQSGVVDALKRTTLAELVAFGAPGGRAPLLPPEPAGASLPLHTAA